MLLRRKEWFITDRLKSKVSRIVVDPSLLLDGLEPFKWVFRPRF